MLYSYLLLLFCARSVIEQANFPLCRVWYGALRLLFTTFFFGWVSNQFY